MDPRITGLRLKTSLSSIADLAIPRVCIVCGRTLICGERHICTICDADFPFTHFESYKYNPMAVKVNERISSGPFVYAAALFFYTGYDGYSYITQRLKYDRDFSSGKYFSGIFGKKLRNSELFGDVDTIIPVPLHWTRKLKRGYNQAEIIAGAIAGSYPEGKAFVASNALVRCKRTDTQTKITPEMKALNVSNAFKVRKNMVPFLKERHHILIIDDVCTSGSTLLACYSAIRSAIGSDVRISLASLGYVGKI